MTCGKCKSCCVNMTFDLCLSNIKLEWQSDGPSHLKPAALRGAIRPFWARVTVDAEGRDWGLPGLTAWHTAKLNAPQRRLYFSGFANFPRRLFFPAETKATGKSLEFHSQSYSGRTVVAEESQEKAGYPVHGNMCSLSNLWQFGADLLSLTRNDSALGELY